MPTLQAVSLDLSWRGTLITHLNTDSWKGRRRGGRGEGQREEREQTEGREGRGEGRGGDAASYRFCIS